MKYAFIVLGIIGFTACQSPNAEKQEMAEQVVTPDSALLSKGFNLLESSCFSCHSPNAAIENKIAPTMSTIKSHYVVDETSFEDFSKQFSSFMNDPSENHSIIPNAIADYGYMPKMSFNEAEVNAMATYIFQNGIEKSEWYANQYEQEKKKYAQTEISPMDQGKQIAMRTKSTLGSNLKKALKSQGTEHALSFCSTRAIPLTDSMSVLQNAKVRRVSDKNRNPNNAADRSQLAYIMQAKETLKNGETIKPQITETEHGYVGYYPILSNKMCLQCHGVPNQDIKPQAYAKIKELYPTDKAVGYKAGELRGIWVIEMER